VFAHALALLPGPDLVVSLTTPPLLGLFGGALAAAHGAAHVQWVMDLHPEALAAHGLVRAEGLAYRRLAPLSPRERSMSRLLVAVGGRLAERLRVAAPPGTAVESVPLWMPEVLAAAPSAEEVAGPSGELTLLYAGNLGLAHRFDEL